MEMIDRPDPNLLRDDFPYSRVPPIRFEPSAVPLATPARVREPHFASDW